LPVYVWYRIPILYTFNCYKRVFIHQDIAWIAGLPTIIFISNFQQRHHRQTRTLIKEYGSVLIRTKIRIIISYYLANCISVSSVIIHCYSSSVLFLDMILTLIAISYKCSKCNTVRNTRTPENHYTRTMDFFPILFILLGLLSSIFPIQLTLKDVQ